MRKTKVKTKKLLIIIIAIIMIILGTIAINATTFDNPTIIGFEDEALYEKIKLELDSNGIRKYQLNKDDETIGELEIKLEDEDLKSVKSLDLQGVIGAQIENLNGLEKFVNLEELNLSGNAITNMETLTQLTKLVSLNMSANNLNDESGNTLNTISELVGLTTLNLANTKIDNLNALAKLNKLENLILSGNQINDFSPIVGFSTIKKLDVSNNSSFVTLGSIASMFNIKELNISYTGLTNLSGIESFNGIEKLYASNITGLQKDLDRIGSLYEGNLINLKVLDLSNSGITEIIDAEGKVTQKANQVPINFKKLASLVALEELYLENMGITKLTGLSGLVNIKVLDLANNKIKSEELDNIIIESKDGIVQEDNVLKATKIELQDNEIIDVSVFAKYPADIAYLDLSRNHIYDTTPLKKHSFSEKLYLKGQDIKFSIYDKAVDVNHYIILPEIFRSNKIEGSLVYSENEFTTEGLELNKKYTKPEQYNVIISHEKTKNDTIRIRINGGTADGTVLNYVVGLSKSSSHNEYVTESLFFKDPVFFEVMKNEMYADPQQQGYEEYMWTFIAVPQEIINIDREVIDLMEILYFDSKSIQDITGIENCSKLTDLYLQGNNISTIQQLEGCPQIVNLKLANNKNLGNNNSSIEKMSKLTYLDLSNTGMTNIDSINNLIDSLRTIRLYELNISQNSLQSIEGLEKIKTLGKLGIAKNQLDEKDLKVIENLTSMTTLDISGNQILDITALANLTNLTHLYFDNNKVQSIEPLTGKKFTELSFKENRVKDITPLSAHSSINKLYMDNNQIEDISILDDISVSEEFSVTGQKIARTLAQNGNSQTEIVLPQIFKAAKTEGNKVYTNKELLLTNCGLNSTGDKVIINNANVTSEAAQVKIYQGKANGTTLTVSIPLTATIQYSVSSDTITNQNVTATIVFNREATVVNNGGKKNYTFTENGEFTFEYTDEFGFSGSATAVVGNIDKIAPVITEVENGKTYNSAVAPIITDANLSEVTLIKDESEIIEQYKSGQTISEKGTYVLKAKDIPGNETVVSFEIKETTVDDKISSTKLTVNEGTLIVKNILPNTSVSELKKMLTSNMKYDIVDKDGKTLSETSQVGTGCKIKLENNKTYTLIVKGDLTGDGEMLDVDLLRMARYKAGLDKNLTGPYLQAADINNNNENADDIDLLKLVRILVGLDRF